MTSKRSQSNGHDWASRLEPECGEHQDRVARLIGRRTVVRCDADHDELVVEVANLRPAQCGAVVDELSGLWPGFLAPAGVSLRIVDGEVWDNEAMALRSFELRHGGA